ncbi:hypothetical protein IWQ47_003624 [Aquimarina sp. EL_43]|uniref:hypothetical protein n=1 Tax=unclassified Aquimarina TaxID=2627091 RepID=UPI0018C9DBB7|nr:MULTISPECIES: hypothetical protein [unclassified Aquimarina]MBG6132404.1 hypothetical protein [Aquimarina sp. EL_35]MBG6152535.1 hypothetical protein [Aquimarina sp. EL_32]MBG6170538.1 hypothetical protein [Aquimarina sp. EL_43]
MISNCDLYKALFTQVISHTLGRVPVNTQSAGITELGTIFSFVLYRPFITHLIFQYLSLSVINTHPEGITDLGTISISAP